MLKHLLVPLNGNPGSEDLLAEVRRLAGFGASKITLVRAELPVAIDEYSVVTEAILEQSQRYLAEMKQRLSDAGIPVEILARIGPPAASVLEAAESTGATMIVMAGLQGNRLARFLLGSVPERIVQESRVPVLVLPPRRESGPIRSILVPLKGGAASDALLPHVLEIARSAGSRLILASVLSPTDEGPGREIFEEAEEVLYAAGSRCAEAGVDFSVIVEYGDPAGRILSLCRDREVDWIAMATRGRSAFSRWLMPSTTNRILRECGHPVLSVRLEPAEEPASFRKASLPGHS